MMFENVSFRVMTLVGRCKPFVVHVAFDLFLSMALVINLEETNCERHLRPPLDLSL